MVSESQTVLEVEGMTCPSCVRHINHALGEIDGVTSIQVNIRDGKVVVGHNAEKAPVSNLIEALADAGYEGKASA